MIHLNGNLLCAVDVETTGDTAGKHDIIQIAVLPLDSQIKPLKGIYPFYTEMQPRRFDNHDPDAKRVHRLDMAALMQRALDPWKVADLFEEWFYKLKLPVNKKIVPLAHNWLFDRDFILDWLGPKTLDTIFHFHYRDSMAAALFINDRADFHVEKIPIPKVGLPYCCSQLGIVNQRAHDALHDCIATAEVYRRLLMF